MLIDIRASCLTAGDRRQHIQRLRRRTLLRCDDRAVGDRHRAIMQADDYAGFLRFRRIECQFPSLQCGVAEQRDDAECLGFARYLLGCRIALARNQRDFAHIQQIGAECGFFLGRIGKCVERRLLERGRVLQRIKPDDERERLVVGRGIQVRRGGQREPDVARRLLRVGHLGLADTGRGHHGARGRAEQRGGRASGQKGAGNQRQRVANHGRSHRFSGVPPLSLSKLPGIAAFAAPPRHCTVQLLSTPASGERPEIFSAVRAARRATSKTCAFRPEENRGEPAAIGHSRG
ncbi:hypothetical protein BCEN4_60013 [Burkholderia cenocepacia]|nr:hypothetical protein BCEN4_60013 [Burkholderia cenocepacia]